MSAWVYFVIGLIVFVAYLFLGRRLSLQLNMEIGLVLALLAATIALDVFPLLQLAAAGVLAMLFLQKGFLRDSA